MKCLLVKYSSEITLKGLNRRSFEDILLREIKGRIGKEFVIKKESGRFFIDGYSDEIIEKLQKVFGIISVAPADIVDKDIELLVTLRQNSLLQKKLQEPLRWKQKGR